MAGWALFDSMVGSLVERGLDNQFLDLETFVLPDGRVEAVELNCRTDCNPIPLFGRVFGAENCMFSAALDLLAGRRPRCADVTPDSQGRIGVVVYYDKEIEGAPDSVENA